MNNRNAILLLLSGSGLIWLRSFFAKQICIHYLPIFSKKLNEGMFCRTLSSIIFCLGMVIALLGGALYLWGEEFALQLVNNFLLVLLLVIASVLYVFWSIPGYYRWKKTNKGVELGLFLVKFIIGIITIIGVIVGYALGKI